MWGPIVGILMAYEFSTVLLYKTDFRGCKNKRFLKFSEGFRRVYFPIKNRPIHMQECHLQLDTVFTRIERIFVALMGCEMDFPRDIFCPFVNWFGLNCYLLLTVVPIYPILHILCTNNYRVRNS